MLEGLAVAGTRIVPLVDEGLGNAAYLADLGDGRALALDVSRYLRAVRAAAGRLGLRIAFAPTTGRCGGSRPCQTLPPYIRRTGPGRSAPFCPQARPSGRGTPGGPLEAGE